MLSRISKKLKRSKLRKTKDEETEKEVEVLPGFRNLFSEEVPRFPEALIKYLEGSLDLLFLIFNMRESLFICFFIFL